MTKKSIGRVARDEAKEKLDKELQNNRQWDELNSLYMRAKAFIAAHSNLTIVLDNPDILRLIEDKKTLVENIKILTRDLRQHNEELEMIYSIHKGRHGDCDVSDIMLHFEIFEKYSQFMTQIQAVVSPTFAHICEQTTQAERLLQLEKAEQANIEKAQDIKDTSVIDIGFTETSKEH